MAPALGLCIHIYTHTHMYTFNRKSADVKDTASKEMAPALGLKPGGLGLRLDLSKAISQVYMYTYIDR